MLGVIQPFPLMISGRQRRFLQGQSFCQSGGEPGYNGRPFHLAVDAEVRKILAAGYLGVRIVGRGRGAGHDDARPVGLGRRIGHDAAPGPQHVQKRLLAVSEARDLFLLASEILLV